MAVAAARVRLDQEVYPPEETSTATSAAAVLSVPGHTLTSILYHGCIRYLRLYIHSAPAGEYETAWLPRKKKQSTTETKMLKPLEKIISIGFSGFDGCKQKTSCRASTLVFGPPELCEIS